MGIGAQLGGGAPRKAFWRRGPGILGSTWKESQGWGAGAERLAFAEGCKWEHHPGGQTNRMLSSCPPSGLLLQVLIKPLIPLWVGGQLI